VKPGKGVIVINERELKSISLEILQTTVKQAFAVSKTEGTYDVTVNVEGGGFQKSRLKQFAWASLEHWLTSILRIVLLEERKAFSPRLTYVERRSQVAEKHVESSSFSKRI